MTVLTEALHDGSRGSASFLTCSSRSVLRNPPADIAFTGERIVPGSVSAILFGEHQARYQFAGGFVRGQFVLDVACGIGIGTQYLAQIGARRCLGIDVDRQAIGYAATHYGLAEFSVGDAANLPVADSSVDLVVSFETLEHLPDQARFVRECHRVLKPGGWFICSTPHHPVYRWNGPNPFHIKELKAEEFVDLLRPCFGTVQLYGQNRVLYPVFVLRRALSRILDAVRLKSWARLLLRIPPPSMVASSAFEPPTGERVDGLQPYSPGWLHQPFFVIAMARKAASAP